jgi:hypothetical protein
MPFSILNMPYSMQETAHPIIKMPFPMLEMANPILKLAISSIARACI